MTEPKVDPAATIGRVAGGTVNALGLRLLRLRMVRQALVNAGQEARGQETLPRPGVPTKPASWGGGVGGGAAQEATAEVKPSEQSS